MTKRKKNVFDNWFRFIAAATGAPAIHIQVENAITNLINQFAIIYACRLFHSLLCIIISYISENEWTMFSYKIRWGRFRSLPSRARFLRIFALAVAAWMEVCIENTVCFVPLIAIMNLHFQKTKEATQWIK